MTMKDPRSVRALRPTIVSPECFLDRNRHQLSRKPLASHACPIVTEDQHRIINRTIHIATPRVSLNRRPLQQVGVTPQIPFAIEHCREATRPARLKECQEISNYSAMKSCDGEEERIVHRTDQPGARIGCLGNRRSPYELTGGVEYRQSVPAEVVSEQGVAEKRAHLQVVELAGTLARPPCRPDTLSLSVVEFDVLVGPIGYREDSFAGL